MVLCVKYANTNVTREVSCQNWVDRFNLEVKPYFERTTDGVTSFNFVLPTYHAGITPPAGHWLPSTIQDGASNFVDNLQDRVINVVDSLVDFSLTDRVVVVIPAADGWGQAFGGEYIDTSADLNTFTFTLPNALDAESDLEFREITTGVFRPARRMSLAMIFEQRVNPTQNGITTPSMFAIHELSHWFGFPERYEPILNGNLDRTPATGFSPMGYSSLDSGRAHHIGYDRFRQGFMDQGTPALTVPKNTQPVVTTVDLVPIDLAPPLNGPLQSSLILVPTEQSADGFVGYTVESRVTGPTFGDIVYENGAIVSFVDTRNRADIFIMDDPNDNQPSVGNTRLAYEANDVFQDATRGVRIEVKAPVIPGTGATQILVTNTTPSQMKPDLEIRQWDERFWATPDIWIDRPPFLNPPDRADDLQGPDPYGNRDTPGVATNPTIENRIYFKVRNGGAATAFNAVVKAYFSMPGIGQGLSDWQPVNPGDQGVSFSQISPGQEVTGYLHWTVPAGTMPDGHACVKVVIQPLATGELSL